MPLLTLHRFAAQSRAIRTPYPSLSVIACGTRRREAPELFGSQRMDALVRELSASYDVILCDSPPLTAGVAP